LVVQYDCMSESGAPSSAGFAEGPVHRAFTLLQLVVDAGEPIGVRELGRRASLSRSTTSRMLALLAELGMVERTPDGGARPGAALTTLTRHAERSPAVLRERLRPLVNELQRTYGENAAAGVDDGERGCLYLASARVPSAVQVADPVGDVFPFHLVAPGLVAMAWWPKQRLDHYLAQPLLAATEHSVVDPKRIRRRLGQIRNDRFAWTDQELDLEVNGLAAPIVDGDGELVAVATLYGPSYRFAETLTPRLGAEFAQLIAARS
jgi:DNA-binding IclR family transcriptional regulator